jgi:hypothetical protein
MELQEMSDSQILKIAAPILSDIVRGSNEKTWDLFSRHMPKENANDEARADVEKQWEDNEYLTSLTETSEFLGVIRKTDYVLVLWKQKSTKVEGEFLEKLYLQEIDEKSCR